MKQRGIDRSLPGRLLPSEARVNDSPQCDNLCQRECPGKPLRVEGHREHSSTKVQDDHRIRSSTAWVGDRLRSSAITQLHCRQGLEVCSIPSESDDALRVDCLKSLRICLGPKR